MSVAELDNGAHDANEAEQPPGQVLAPLSQAVTPLQLPAVRPNLLLGPYDTYEEARAAAMEYAIAQGYMLVQIGRARAKAPGGNYVPGAPIVRVDLTCDRGGTCKNAGTGKRKRPTHKLGCPTRLKLLCRKRDGSKWFIDPQCEAHNHDLAPGNMESIAAYRRWRRGQTSIKPKGTHKERCQRLPEPKPPPPRFHNAAPPLPPATSDPPAALAATTSPLHTAALRGQLKIVEILLSKGADVNAHDSAGRTPLHCAIEGAHMETVKLIVDRGADVTRGDRTGLSPLHMAVEKGLEDAVVLLIERGADPNK